MSVGVRKGEWGKGGMGQPPPIAVISPPLTVKSLFWL
jgi:hypothetical protein